MTNSKNIITINLQETAQILRSSINGAEISAGFAYNLKEDINFTNYALVEDSKIQIVPVTPDIDTIQKYKTYNYNWVIKNSLKDVIDTFSIFLEEIYKTCLLFSQQNKKLSNELIAVMESKRASYHKKPFSNKLEELHAQFNISPQKSHNLQSLQNTRNCFCHRRGRVGPEDLKKNTQFIVQWAAHHLYALDPLGNEIDFNNIPPEGILLPKGGDLMVKLYAEKEKIFVLGDEIYFSAKEFSEILLYLRAEADHILKEVKKFANTMGIFEAN